MSEGQRGNDERGDGAADEGAIVGVYRKYVGEPETRRDVYIGFGLFFAGIAIGVVGLALFLYSGTQTAESSLFWQFREIAIVFAMLALPAVAVSVAVLLPVGRQTMGASIAGAAICVVAVGWFTFVYPFEWTAAGNDIAVIGIYAVGIALLAGSTGSALVAQYIDRVSGFDRGQAVDTTTETEDETVSDERVATDIEEALSNSTLTWGGIEKEPATKRLKLNLPETDLDQPNTGEPSERRSAGDDVDSAVAELRQLQGNDQKTARTDSPDEQVTALTEFRRDQEEDDIETGVGEERGFFERVYDKLSVR
jgi:hypothetical protein